MTAVAEAPTADEAPDAPAPLTIPGPGIYDIPEDVYHADPIPGGSLSSTGARRLQATCPAIFRWEQDHPQPFKREFNLGRAAHREVLGAGADFEVMPANDYRTNAAKEARDEALANGLTPLLPKEYAVVKAMADALWDHPKAAALLDRDSGKPEQSAFVRARRGSKVILRARYDLLRRPYAGELIIPDYKSCRSAHPDAISRALEDYGYAQQGDFYARVARLLGLAEQVVPVFIFQEKTPPYVVTVAQPDPNALRIAGHRNAEAIDLYAECTATGRWPGYSDGIELVSLPPWVERQYEKETW